MMEHQLTITVSDDVFQPLIKAALQAGCTPEEYLGERVVQVLPAKAINGETKKQGDITRFFGSWDSNEPLNSEARAQAKARLKDFAGAVNSGDPHAANNDRIDADLAREYANPYETED